jgi:2-methylcitrate dehydratase PrpD
MALALGIAGTQAAGLKSMFGTMCKPLHCGTAARNGLLAATLAARGFESRPDVLECEQGFAATQSADFQPEAALNDPPGGFHIRNNLFKFHAACYLTHAAIECGSRLREQHGLDVENIRDVRVRVDPACDGVCNISKPMTGLEAKFSLRLTTALALSGADTSAIESYSDAACVDSSIARLRDKVTVEFVSGFSRTYTEVSVVDRDGYNYDTTHDAGVPAAELDWQRERLERKCRSLLLPLMGADDCHHLIEHCRDLDELDSVRDLTQAVCVGSNLPAKAPSGVSQ